MEPRHERDLEQRLERYLDQVGDTLGNEHRKASFALYAMGLLGEGDRKSMEPIAARACADPKRTGAVHQQVQHFIADSRWCDRDVRRFGTTYAVHAMMRRGPIEAWIIDDTGFLKQGVHSVGVQRQYTGSAGKVANCQIGTSLVVATRTQHLAIDFELYLPRSWTDDPERRLEARIPDDVVFKTKPQLAIDMIRRALEDGVPPAPVLADCGYGDSGEFRGRVRELGLEYAVGIEAPTKVLRVDRAGRRNGSPRSVLDLARKLHRQHGGFRRLTWRQGTRKALASRFAFCRVIPSGQNVHPADQHPMWLAIEWPDREEAPSNYYLISVPGLGKKQMVRLVKERYRTEAAYEELKGELGLDHFEGRRYRGWHHHVSVALCCHAFLVAERSRRFPPSARGTATHGPLSVAA